MEKETKEFLQAGHLNLAYIEWQIIMKALRETEGRRSEAADLLGISSRTLRNKLAKYRSLDILDRNPKTGLLVPYFDYSKWAI